VVPSEASVITAGVFAAAGDPSLPLVIVVAALGAFAGDQVSYAAGRLAGPGRYERARPGGRRRAALDRARAALAARGGVIIVVSRYVPAGRTAVTLTAGELTRHLLRRRSRPAAAGSRERAHGSAGQQRDRGGSSQCSA